MPPRVWLRLLLGILQIGGATAGLLLVLADGVTTPALVVTGLTAAVGVISRILFRHNQGRS